MFCLKPRTLVRKHITFFLHKFILESQKMHTGFLSLHLYILLKSKMTLIDTVLLSDIFISLNFH